MRDTNAIGRTMTLLLIALVPCATVHATSSTQSGQTQQHPAPMVTPASADQAKPEEHVDYRTVTGQVSGVSHAFIAVEYQHDAAKGSVSEMAFPVDPSVQSRLKETLKTLKVGDTVTVDYREVTLKDQTGKVTGVQRMATNVTFVASAAPSETPQESVPTTAGQ